MNKELKINRLTITLLIEYDTIDAFILAQLHLILDS